MDQHSLQRNVERTLFSFCDDMGDDEVGMQWSFDWLFAPGQAFALSVGTFYQPDRSFAHVTFRHQEKDKETVVYELELPVESLEYDASRGEATINYQGMARYQIHRHDERSSACHGYVELQLVKELFSHDRHLSYRGMMTLRPNKGGRRITYWNWDYLVEAIVDRPDYMDKLLVGMLQSGLIPSGNGHFIPAMHARLVEGSYVTYATGDGAAERTPVHGAYLDGNFGRSKTTRAVVTDRWAWMAAPQTWTMDGRPSDHMMTFGFFHRKLLPLTKSNFTGAILWRQSPNDMNCLGPKTLLDRFEVRAHSPRYLDVSITTHDRRYRITVRAWANTTATPLPTPEGGTLMDYQDLQADAFILIEKNKNTGASRFLKKPKWEPIERLVTDAFGFEFGEQEEAIGVPDYPAYDAVPERPTWFVRALDRIPAQASHPVPAYRLSPLNRSNKVEQSVALKAA